MLELLYIAIGANIFSGLVLLTQFNNKRSNKILHFTLIAILIIISIFRDGDFNHDTHAYQNYIGNASESRIEFFFKYILEYSESILSFNLMVAIIKILLLVVIFVVDRKFESKIFWLYYVFCLELLFDYTLARYGVGILFIVCSYYLISTGKTMSGRLMLIITPGFHYSALPAYILLGKNSTRNNTIILLLLLLSFIFLGAFLKDNIILLFNYLESKEDGYIANSLKIYKTLFDTFFIFYFSVSTKEKFSYVLLFLFITFSTLDFSYPAFGLNRIRIIFEALIILAFAKNFNNYNRKLLKHTAFFSFVFIRATISIYDFIESSLIT